MADLLRWFKVWGTKPLAEAEPATTEPVTATASGAEPPPQTARAGAGGGI